MNEELKQVYSTNVDNPKTQVGQWSKHAYDSFTKCIQDVQDSQIVSPSVFKDIFQQEQKPFSTTTLTLGEVLPPIVFQWMCQYFNMNIRYVIRKPGHPSQLFYISGTASKRTINNTMVYTVPSAQNKKSMTYVTIVHDVAAKHIGIAQFSPCAQIRADKFDPKHIQENTLWDMVPTNDRVPNPVPVTQLASDGYFDCFAVSDKVKTKIQTHDGTSPLDRCIRALVGRKPADPEALNKMVGVLNTPTIPQVKFCVFTRSKKYTNPGISVLIVKGMQDYIVVDHPNKCIYIPGSITYNTNAKGIKFDISAWKKLLFRDFELKKFDHMPGTKTPVKTRMFVECCLIRNNIMHDRRLFAFPPPSAQKTQKTQKTKSIYNTSAYCIACMIDDTIYGMDVATTTTYFDPNTSAPVHVYAQTVQTVQTVPASSSSSSSTTHAIPVSSYVPQMLTAMAEDIVSCSPCADCF
jgi:hypothetical protein